MKKIIILLGLLLISVAPAYSKNLLSKIVDKEIKVIKSAGRETFFWVLPAYIGKPKKYKFVLLYATAPLVFTTCTVLGQLDE